MKIFLTFFKRKKVMIDIMEIERKQILPNQFIAYPAIISLIFYVFFYQFAYPFSSTIFLYFAFGCTVLWMVFFQKIKITRQMFIMAMVTFVSLIGATYTDMPEKGNREKILTVIICILIVAYAQNNALIDKLKKAIYICSFFVLVGVIFQYLFTDTANNMLRTLLRSDSYERLMWSYNVDGAYAGFSAYTPDAAYFCAILLIFSIFRWLQSKNLSVIGKLEHLSIIALSFFAIMLTSKRGIAVAVAISFVLSYMIWRNCSIKMIISTIAIIVLSAVAIKILSDHNQEVSLFLQRFTSNEGDMTTGRSKIWQHAIENLSNSLFGMGTGAAYAIYSTGLHNIYLQLYYDHGLIGAMIYIVFFVYNLRCAIERKEPIAISVQLLMLVYGISGNPIYSNSFFIVYIIFSVVPVERTYQSELT